MEYDYIISATSHIMHGSLVVVTIATDISVTRTECIVNQVTIIIITLYPTSQTTCD